MLGNEMTRGESSGSFAGDRTRTTKQGRKVGKLSLRKRRREKRKQNMGNTDTSTTNTTKYVKRFRPPIPSFSPIEEEDEEDVISSKQEHPTLDVSSPCHTEEIKETKLGDGIETKEMRGSKLSGEIETVGIQNRNDKDLMKDIKGSKLGDEIETKEIKGNKLGDEIETKETKESKSGDETDMKERKGNTLGDESKTVSLSSSCNDEDLKKEKVPNETKSFEHGSKEIEDENRNEMKGNHKKEPQDVPVNTSHLKPKNGEKAGDLTSEKTILDSIIQNIQCKKIESIVPPCTMERFENKLSMEASIVQMGTKKVTEHPQQCRGLQNDRKGKRPPKVEGVKKGEPKRKQKQKQKKVCDFNQPLSQGFDDFEISRTKALADIQKKLNRQHKTLLEQSKNDLKKSYSTRSGVYDVKKSAKKCALCLTCSCSAGSSLQSLEKGATCETNNNLRGLARSNAEIETALTARLTRLEKSASWFDHLCFKTARDLKRHRAKLAKNKIEIEGAGMKKEKIRFLHDVDDNAFDVNLQISANPLPDSMIHEATEKSFAFRRRCQPTLTQMVESDEVNEPEIKVGEDVETTADGYKNERAFGDHFIDGCEAKEDDPLDRKKALDRGKDGVLWEASRNYNEFNETCIKNRRQIITNCEDYAESNANDIDSFLTENEDNGIEELLQIYENSAQTLNPETDEIFQSKTSIENEIPQEAGEHPPVTLSQLTTQGREIFTSIERNITSDVMKVEILDFECPNWRENIRFAFDKKNPLELKSALSRVQSRKEKVHQKRQNVLEFLEREDTVLELYESVLSASLTRK